MLEGNNTKVEYDKIQPIKDQYCFIKVEIKELDNGEIVKQEVVECADGRKAYDGPSYWELFAQFYYRDMFTPVFIVDIMKGLTMPIINLAKFALIKMVIGR